MSRDKSQSIFGESRHLNRDEMIRYHHHMMDEKEVYDIERHLADCSLCNEALKGVAEMEDALKLHNVTRDLNKRAREKNLSKRKFFSQLDLISIMAVMLLIAFLVAIGFYFVMSYRK